MESRNPPDNSSHRQENTPGLFDRISVLPDSILGLILSCLPTKDAVATTILSKRWKFLWKTVHNLDFCLELDDDSENELSEEEDMKFVRFVNHVLLLHDGGSLNKFCLVWKPRCIPEQVISWINTAIARNIHHLAIFITTFHCDFEVPISLFSCISSLQSLELGGTISVFDLAIVNVICFPRLEILKLYSVYFSSEEAFEKLISGCPMLNYMHLHIDPDELVTYSEDIAMFRYKISSNSLKRLKIRVRYSEDYRYIPYMKINAFSLVYLKLGGYIPEVSVQGTLSSLVEADFQILFGEDEFFEDNHKWVVEAVHAFDCAKSLTLSPEVMWALSNATVCLPKFTRLTKLKARATSCYCSSLRDFIQSADCLEDLTIYQDISHEEEYHDHSKWIAPVEVPRCLSNSLKVLAIEGYSGYDDEHEMIGYMLKHGSVLNAMQVTSYACIRKEVNFELFKEMICRFPRKSPSLLNVKLWSKHCSARSCSICESVGLSDMEIISIS